MRSAGHTRFPMLAVIGATVGAMALTMPAPGCAAETTVVLTAAADARILKIAPDLNQGALSSIAVYNNGAANEQRTLIHFDLSSIPTGATVLSATLKLVERDTFFTSNGLPTYLYRASAGWDENTVTWNSANLAFAEPAGAPYASANDTPGLRLEIEARELVQEWLDGAEPNQGFYLSAPAGNYLHFHSREAATVSDRPTLAVTYTCGVPCAIDLVEGLKEGVDSLVGSGAALPADGNSLQVKLDASLDCIAAGDRDGAIGKLHDFMNQIRAFVKTGRLTEGEGQSLIGPAQDAVSALGG